MNYPPKSLGRLLDHLRHYQPWRYDSVTVGPVAVWHGGDIVANYTWDEKGNPCFEFTARYAVSTTCQTYINQQIAADPRCSDIKDLK